MNAKIAHFSELSNILGDINAMCNEFLRLMGQFGIASSLSRMKMEKEKGSKVSDLLSCLIIFRLCGMSVFKSYQQHFMSLIKWRQESVLPVIDPSRHELEETPAQHLQDIFPYR